MVGSKFTVCLSNSGVRKNASKFCKKILRINTSIINVGDTIKASPNGKRVAVVGPIVGINVSNPQINELRSASGTFNIERPIHVKAKIVSAEIVIPVNHPPKAILQSSKSSDKLFLSGLGVKEINIFLCASGSNTTRIASKLISRS